MYNSLYRTTLITLNSKRVNNIESCGNKATYLTYNYENTLGSMRMHYTAFTYLIKYPNRNLLFLKQIMNISQHFDPCFNTHDKGFFFIQSAEKCSQNYNLLVHGNFSVKMNQYFTTTTISAVLLIIIPMGSCLKCYVCNNLRNTVQVSLKIQCCQLYFCY